MDLFPGYCIDTSALIDLGRTRYTREVFPSLWKEIEELVSKGELVAPREVLKELERQNDELTRWAKKHRKMFVNLDPEQIKIVKEILRDFPGFVDEKKETEDADPFVIALAKARGSTVITSEKPADLAANPRAKPKIPNVCQHYQVKCVHP